MSDIETDAQRIDNLIKDCGITDNQRFIDTIEKVKEKFNDRRKNKKFKPKTKETWRKDATIKIKTLLEVTEKPKGCFSNKEKLINVKINNGQITTSTSFEVNREGTKELLEFIKKELYLK